MSRNGKFLFGALLGALFGLAFAPKKGSELRKELQEEIKTGGHGEKTLQKNAKIIGEDVAVTAKEVIEDPEVQKHLERVKEEGTKVLNSAKKNLESTGEEWMEVARDKIMVEKAALEKHATKTVNKAFDTIKKKVTENVKQKPASKTHSTAEGSKPKSKKKS